MSNLIPMLLIDGIMVESSADKTVDLVNPSTAQAFGCLSIGSDHDVERAVSSARAAFNDARWSGAAPSHRKSVLLRFAELIEKQSAELDLLDAQDMGKPISLQVCNAAGAGGFVRFYAEAIDKISGDVFTSDAKTLALQRRIPHGVVAGIIPWNFPTFCAVLKIAPALAAGNCIVIKPSELAPRSTLRLAQLALEAGLPTGVLNVVSGVGDTVGRALALHEDVDLLTFTGSTQVGKKILQCSGQSNMKRLMLECGGKSPQIVFNDGVDLDDAAAAVADLILVNQGQLCSTGSRLLVHRSIEEEFNRKVADRLRSVTIGDATDPVTTFGPMVSRKQGERVMSFISEARQNGDASLITGGKQVLEDRGGYYLEPTLFAGVDPHSSMAQDEIFGPVLAAIPFDDDDDAISLANCTRYGLACYAWTASLTTGMRLAKEIRSTVVINSASTVGEEAGFAGSHEPVGHSGFGAEFGMAGFESYTRRHSVSFNHG